MRLRLLCVVTLAAHARVVRAHIFSWLIDASIVCEPDFVQCPNGGLAFRDRLHECKFTPCKFIPAPPLPPPPPDPKTLPLVAWFGAREFVVPAFDVATLQRGKQVEHQWADAITTKLAFSKQQYAAAVDLYVVPPPPPPAVVPFEDTAHTAHVMALLASEVELLATLKTNTFAVSHRPWTRWQFFGQVVGDGAGCAPPPPSVVMVQAALQLLRGMVVKPPSSSSPSPSNSTPSGSPSRSGGALFASLVVEANVTDDDASESSELMMDLLSQCESMLVGASGLVEYVNETSVKVLQATNGLHLNVLVFTTVFPGRAMEPQPPGEWNVTLVDCPPGTAAAALGRERVGFSNGSTITTTAGELLSPRLLLSPSATASTATNCSCWQTQRGPTKDPRGAAIPKLPTQRPPWMLCH